MKFRRKDGKLLRVNGKLKRDAAPCDCCGGTPCLCAECPDGIGPCSATITVSGVTQSAWKDDNNTYVRTVGGPNISGMELVNSTPETSTCGMGRTYFCEVTDPTPDAGNYVSWSGRAGFEILNVGGQLKLLVTVLTDVGGLSVFSFYGWVDIDDCNDATYTIDNAIIAEPADTTTQDMQTFAVENVTDVFGSQPSTSVITGWGGSATVTIRFASSVLNSIPQPCECVPLPPGGCRSDCASAYLVTLSGVTTPSINGSTTVTRDPGNCDWADSGGTGTEVVIHYEWEDMLPIWRLTITQGGAVLQFYRDFADIDVCECPSGGGWTFDAGLSSGYTGTPAVSVS